jgi:hypothetical protein
MLYSSKNTDVRRIKELCGIRARKKPKYLLNEPVLCGQA